MPKTNRIEYKEKLTRDLDLEKEGYRYCRQPRTEN
jgi:hypothetical protein